MKINTEKLQKALVIAQTALKKGDLPRFLKTRWLNALEKAGKRLIEQPVFAWQPARSIIVSVPKESEKRSEIGCRFYEAHEEACRRLDKSGFCQAFFEGFPCWHRAAHLLLGIYFGDSMEKTAVKDQKPPINCCGLHTKPCGLTYK